MFDAQNRRRCVSEDVTATCFSLVGVSGCSSRGRTQTQNGSMHAQSRGSTACRLRRSATTGVETLNNASSHIARLRRSATTGAETNALGPVIETKSDDHLSRGVSTPWRFICRILGAACPSRNRRPNVRTANVACVTATRSRIHSAADTSPPISSRRQS